ncbi:MAG: DbpA RNA binding domain-containing protein [Spirochaetales bacterium]|nr:DbpA RNA binding domain-containing protein [Spirochaetales bacterium]
MHQSKLTEDNENYRKIIEKAGFRGPNQFQKKLIPASLDNRYIIAETSEGCGKNLGIAVSVILQTNASLSGLKFLIIASSPDNVKKINNIFKKLFSKKITNLTVIAASSETNIKKDYNLLRKQPDIFIGTPDRIIDHIRRDNISFEGIQGCIIEDSCIDDLYGFEKDIEFIFSKLSGKQSFMVLTKKREHAYSFYHYFKKPVIIKIEDKEAVMTEKKSIESGYIKNITDQIKQSPDIKELADIKKLIKKNVPFFMRGYFAAFLLRKLYDGTPLFEREKTASGEYKTLFINAGRNKGFFIKDISNIFSSSGLADKTDVKNIKVLDNYSFADVTSERADKIVQNLNNTVFKGKKLSISLARSTRSSKAPDRSASYRKRPGRSAAAGGRSMQAGPPSKGQSGLSAE